MHVELVSCSALVHENVLALNVYQMQVVGVSHVRVVQESVNVLAVLSNNYHSAVTNVSCHCTHEHEVRPVVGSEIRRGLVWLPWKE